MLSRRSIFSLFAGAGAIAAGAKVQAAPAPSEINDAARRVWVASSDPTPRPSHYAQGSMFPRGMLVTGKGIPNSISDGLGGIFPLDSPQGQSILANSRMALPDGDDPTYPRGKMLGRWISNGDHFVLLESSEGQAVLQSIAAPNAGMSRW